MPDPAAELLSQPPRNSPLVVRERASLLPIAAECVTDATAALFHHEAALSFCVLRDERFRSVLGAAKSGAEWAIAELYRDLQPRVLRFLHAQAPAHGDDLASEVWVDVARGLQRFDGDETAFRRWLFTIARRRLIDFRRSEERRRAATSKLVSQGVDLTGADPESLAVAASDEELALARIGRLPAAQAEVVLLRVVAGFDAEEVAALVGKSAGAVRVLQHRALKTLSSELVRERRKAEVTE